MSRLPGIVSPANICEITLRFSPVLTVGIINVSTHCNVFESPEVFPLGRAYPKKERMLELQVISFINEAFHRKKKKERERDKRKG